MSGIVDCRGGSKPSEWPFSTESEQRRCTGQAAAILSRYSWYKIGTGPLGDSNPCRSCFAEGVTFKHQRGDVNCETSKGETVTVRALRGSTIV